jgi:hypothetical protein
MSPAEAVFWDQARDLFDEATVARMRESLTPGALITRARALGAVFRMSNWQHGYGQDRLATTDDCVRCLDHCSRCGGRGGDPEHSGACGECGRVAT